MPLNAVRVGLGVVSRPSREHKASRRARDVPRGWTGQHPILDLVSGGYDPKSRLFARGAALAVTSGGSRHAPRVNAESESSRRRDKSGRSTRQELRQVRALRRSFDSERRRYPRHARDAEPSCRICGRARSPVANAQGSATSRMCSCGSPREARATGGCPTRSHCSHRASAMRLEEGSRTARRNRRARSLGRRRSLPARRSGRMRTRCRSPLPRQLRLPSKPAEPPCRTMSHPLAGSSTPRGPDGQDLGTARLASRGRVGRLLFVAVWPVSGGVLVRPSERSQRADGPPPTLIQLRTPVRRLSCGVPRRLMHPALTNLTRQVAYGDPMKRNAPNWTLRDHWRTLIVFMLLFTASYFVRPGWLQLPWLVIWAVAFVVTVRVQVRNASR